LKVNKKNIEAVIATNRFGMGARPNEINEAKSDPRGWLIDSLSPITPPDSAPTAIEMIRLWGKFKQQKDTKKPKSQKKTSEKKVPVQSKISQNGVIQLNSGLIVKEAIKSKSSINFRLLDFFSNHFSVSANNTGMRFLAPTLDWDAIAPNLTKTFSKMLIAVISHPAMLLYLNNEKSIGPNSNQGRKRKNKGLNENLAREILELHTLGVGNYSQKDIIELAKALSGWSITKHNKESEFSRDSAFIFRPHNHEPGSRTVLEKRYPDTGKNNKQLEMILTDLANHPSTALYVCNKLARHFISDTPDPKLVNEMSSVWLKTKGDLTAVLNSLIKSDLSWEFKPEKYKSPREFLISTYRITGTNPPHEVDLFKSLKHLGQAPYQAGSPAGYGDTKNAWNGSDALFNRIQWSASLSKRMRNSTALKLSENALGNNLDKHSFNVINQAESQQQAISLLLMSPEFLYR